jgi:hypothetical protein
MSEEKDEGGTHANNEASEHKGERETKNLEK